jgi:hypothetical protein
MAGGSRLMQDESFGTDIRAAVSLRISLTESLTHSCHSQPLPTSPQMNVDTSLSEGLQSTQFQFQTVTSFFKLFTSAGRVSV